MEAVPDTWLKTYLAPKSHTERIRLLSYRNQVR